MLGIVALSATHEHEPPWLRASLGPPRPLAAADSGCVSLDTATLGFTCSALKVIDLRATSLVCDLRSLMPDGNRHVEELCHLIPKNSGGLFVNASQSRPGGRRTEDGRGRHAKCEDRMAMQSCDK